MALTPRQRTEAQKAGLTHRQITVLDHRLDGHSWRTIALALHINEATARGHFRSAMTKIRAHRKDTA